MKKILLILLIGITYTFASIGKITAVKGEVYIIRDTQQIVAKSGSLLELKDQVQTKKKAKALVLFNDSTSITVGNNSTLSVNEFVMDLNNPKKSKTNFGFGKGVFRTITGRIGKINPKGFKIKTKSASIGIRGTIFTVEITPKDLIMDVQSGATWMLPNNQTIPTDVPEGSVLVFDDESGSLEVMLKAVFEKKKEEEKQLANSKQDEEVPEEQENSSTTKNTDENVDTTGIVNKIIEVTKESNEKVEEEEESSNNSTDEAEDEDQKQSDSSTDDDSTSDTENTNSDEEKTSTDTDGSTTDADESTTDTDESTTDTDESTTDTGDGIINGGDDQGGQTPLPVVDTITYQSICTEGIDNCDHFNNFDYGYELTDGSVTDIYITDKILTTAETIQSYMDSPQTASYYGSIAAIVNGATTEEGSIYLNFTFGASSDVSGTIKVTEGDWQASFTTGTVNTTGFSVNTITGTSTNSTITGGNINGKYYGPNAEFVGGKFSLSNSETTINGAFAAPTGTPP